MEVRYKPSEDDLVALTWLEAKRSPTLRRQYFGTYFGVPTAVAGLWLAVVLLTSEDSAGHIGTGIAVVAFAVFWFFWWPAKYSKTIRKYVQTTLKEGRSRVQLAERHIVCDTLGIKTHTDFGDDTLKWQAIQRMEETNDRLFLFLAQFSAVVVPRRAFASAQEFQEFVGFVRQLYASNHP